MRKKLLMYLSVFLLVNPLLAADLIPLSVGIVKNKPSGLQNPKSPSPMEPPAVYLEDCTLSFDAFEEDWAIQLLDKNNVVVFSSVIPSGTTMFQLPTTLEGEYQIQLIQGNILYWGIIILDSKSLLSTKITSQTSTNLHLQAEAL